MDGEPSCMVTEGRQKQWLSWQFCSLRALLTVGWAGTLQWRDSSVDWTISTELSLENSRLLPTPSMGTPSLGVLLSLLGAGCVVDPSGFGWIPKCTNSSLWVSLLGNCSLALTGECPWKSLVVMIDHSGGLRGKPWWSHPEIVSQNPSMNQDQGTTASGLSPKTVCSTVLEAHGPVCACQIPSTSLIPVPASSPNHLCPWIPGE